MCVSLCLCVRACVCLCVLVCACATRVAVYLVLACTSCVATARRRASIGALPLVLLELDAMLQGLRERGICP